MPKVFIVPHFVGREPYPEEASEFYKHCVGPGWQKILLDLTDKLFHLGWDGGLEQVKEKFGTLRFYWRNNIEEGMKSEIAEDLVSYAESKSGWTCERCGEFGERHGDGWVHTMCAQCWDIHVKDKEERQKRYAEDAISHPVD